VSHHLPVLLVVVPLIAAPVAALVMRPRIAWAVALAACWWAFGASIALLRRVLA
jgi:multicomponent Na+:H+ antiporter subunit D